MQKSNAGGPQAIWLSRVKSFRESGLTQAQFCRENKYNIKQFNYWFRKFKDSKTTMEPEKPQWISMDIAVPSNNDFLTVRIGSVAIEVKPGFNNQLLAEVVEALSKLC